MTTLMTFILFILIFGVVVISHEFGHYLIAKANGIHVVEFAIGMGPTLFSWKKKETEHPGGGEHRRVISPCEGVGQDFHGAGRPYI